MAMDFQRLAELERPTVMAQTADKLVDVLAPSPLPEHIACQLRIGHLTEADDIDPDELDRLRRLRKCS